MRELRQQRSVDGNPGGEPLATLHSRPPLERMLHIHQVVAANKYPNTVSLSRELEVTSKTIQRDIEF
ncbi:MAG TPA: hypothetical protein VF607_13880, partial [Verrucomicrobiae bacterium]